MSSKATSESVEGFVKLMRSIWYNKTSRGGREQVKGGKRGESRQAPRMRRVFEILLRRYFWHRGRLTKHFDPTFTRSCDQAIFSYINYDDDDDDGDYCEAPIPIEVDSDSEDESDSDDEDELSDEELADLLAEEGGYAHLSSTGMMDVSE